MTSILRQEIVILVSLVIVALGEFGIEYCFVSSKRL